jgi:hypothetical protein
LSVFDGEKMLNLLKRLKNWLIASIVIANTAASAQQSKNYTNTQISYDRGHEVSSCQMMASYNAPAGFNVCHSWDVYATASFIYWQARQENIEIGLISRNDPEGLSSITSTDVGPFQTPYVNNMTITSPNFTYRPGFKVGLGANWDDWDAYAEYTWFHGSIGSGVKPLPRSTATGDTIPNGEYLYPIQGPPHDFGDFYRNADQSWSLKMDFLDLSLARAYYSGAKLTVRPFFGARGAWIRQNLTTTYDGSSNYLDPRIAEGYKHFKVSNYSASWGVGPRAGFESNWLLGYGCRLIGNGAADILYTRYDTHITEIEYQFAGTLRPLLNGNPILSNASVSQVIDLLRTHLDFEMGFGWGSYFCRNEYHVDLSATYGFQVFWDQNMFRNFYDDTTPAKSSNPNGNLYVHGLTANATLDF